VFVYGDFDHLISHVLGSAGFEKEKKSLRADFQRRAG
jgi:hypothetical protein